MVTKAQREKEKKKIEKEKATKEAKRKAAVIDRIENNPRMAFKTDRTTVMPSDHICNPKPKKLEDDVVEVAKLFRKK